LKTLRTAQVGKATLRLVETAKGFSGVILFDDAVKNRLDGADADDVWRRLHDEVAKSSPRFFGYGGARARFLRIFPEGFSSDEYAARERDYKVAAKEKLDSLVPLQAAVERRGLGERVLSIFRATNLLSPFEKPRITEALRGSSADSFIQGAARFAMGEMQAGLLEMERALKPYEIAKWTAVTYLPYLWRPESHMFLKLEVTKNFADRVGHSLSNS
jgi:hypothetical protein